MSEVVPRNCVSDGRAQWHHLTNTVERLWAAAIIASATRVATRPVPKLLGQFYLFLACVRILVLMILAHVHRVSKTR